ncbi:MAG: alanyl-tRNA editing protein [Burkholderiales bacterium]|nr:alanyl-tRNA editing protein [Burkholderiales bacterium]
MTELVFRDDAYCAQLDAHVVAVRPWLSPAGATHAALVLDRSIFYYESGGQPGDRGALRWQDAGGTARTAHVIDTRRDRASGEILHVLAAGADAHAATPPAEGTGVTLSLDWPRRHRHMRFHTALHLVCAALPGILATGNAIDVDKARIDFDLSGVEFDRDGTEARLNALIAGQHDVTTHWISDDELAAQPDLVRTMSVAPPTGSGRVRLVRVGDRVDLQPCGGTHVRNTGEIGAVRIVKVENKGRQNRRLVLQLVE